MKELLTLPGIRSYLAHSAWVHVHDFKGLAEVWRRKLDGETQELLIPSNNAADYQPRYEELVAALSRYEALSIAELTQAILSISYDRLSIRVEHDDVSDGTIPINDGIELTRNSRELLVAAANASLERRRRFQGRLPVEVAQLINHTRLGQTEIGSFVVNVYCTIMPASGRAAPFEAGVPGTLCAALSALKSSILEMSERRSPVAFESALAQGASSNMCDALIGLFGQDAARDVTIAFCPGKGERLFAPDKFEFKFRSREVPSLRLASDYFKQIYTLEDVEVAGYIKRLDRDLDEEFGQVWIHAVLPNNQEKNVQLQLSDVDYQRAIHAHEDKHLVRCRGNVVVSPRSARLVDLQFFDVLSTGQLFL